jgi:hypothetical protein
MTEGSERPKIMKIESEPVLLTIGIQYSFAVFVQRPHQKIARQHMRFLADLMLPIDLVIVGLLGAVLPAFHVLSAEITVLYGIIG